MAHASNRLNVKQVAAAKMPGMYADGNGLYLQVTTAGARSWLLRYRLGDKRREMGLGSLVDVGLAQARDLAQDARKLIAGGVDPIEARKAQAARKAAAIAAAAKPAGPAAFKAVAGELIGSFESGWRNAKHRAQWPSTLKAYAYPVIGDMDVAKVGTEHVLQILRPIWTLKPETASRVRGRVERVLAYAKVQGLRSGENPAQWKNHLDQLLPPRGKVRRVRHHPALPYAQVPGFMARLRARDSTGARATELTILTAVRTGETTGATWSEFDLEAKLWTIPGERMKAGLEHRVPLCDRAVAIVREMAETPLGPYVFPGARSEEPLSDMALLMCVRGQHVGITVHGFRSSFRDWAGEETAHPHDICEAALAHTRKDKTHAAYQRGDLLKKRRALMDDWAAFCMPTQEKVKKAAKNQRRTLRHRLQLVLRR